MPGFGKPALLRESAMEVLTEFFRTPCSRCIEECDFHLLRMYVDYMMKDLDPRIPCNLAADFYNKLLPCFFECEKETVQDMTRQLIMNRKIVGLKCQSFILHKLDFGELRCIKGLWELNLQTRLVHMAGLHLGDLRKLIYRTICTDSDLKVIERDCPRLEHLDISMSKKVTDVGLRDLSQCTNMHSLSAGHCPAISFDGIADLLSVNNNVENLSIWTEHPHDGFERFFHMDGSVNGTASLHTSTKLTNDNLRSIVVKFPNLRSIRIIGYCEGNLSVLEDLSQLSKLELQCQRDLRMWNYLQPGLRCIGSVIGELKFSFSGNLLQLQRCLNSIFEFCTNVRDLGIWYRVDNNEGVLSIPPFQKLKSLLLLNLHVLHESRNAAFRFERLFELETLTIAGKDMTTESMEWLVFDKTEYYPNLKSLSLRGPPFSVRNLEYAEKISKDNNLNLSVEYSELY